METLKMDKVNVAPSSTGGHFVKNAKQVINLDEVNETFKVEGSAILETENHTTVEIEEDCLITCQTVFNPLSKLYERVKD